MEWRDTPKGRGLRIRCAAHPVPESLPQVQDADQRALLKRWVSKESAQPKHATLLNEAGHTHIECANALCDWLLTEGWIERHERLRGGIWHWEAIHWRDLPRLQTLLGVSSKTQRAEQRQSRLDEAQAWLQSRRESIDERSLDPDLLDELTRALAQLSGDKMLRQDLLSTRLNLLQALASWHDGGHQGLRQDFALHARNATKALSVAEWRWLEGAFNLERLRIARFAPVVWLAGDLVLHWDAQSVHAAPLHFLALPLADLARVDKAQGPQRWWLIENRTSFERQAQQREPGMLLVWLPGRPSMAWLAALSHLLTLAPAPAWISADADPAGVDIACTAGALWEARGLAWTPHQMGPAELAATRQQWPLNEHDHRLIAALLARPAVPLALRDLCEAMRRDARKAEQEGWI